MCLTRRRGTHAQPHLLSTTITPPTVSSMYHSGSHKHHPGCNTAWLVPTLHSHPVTYTHNCCSHPHQHISLSLSLTPLPGVLWRVYPHEMMPHTVSVLHVAHSAQIVAQTVQAPPHTACNTLTPTPTALHVPVNHTCWTQTHSVFYSRSRVSRLSPTCWWVVYHSQVDLP